MYLHRKPIKEEKINSRIPFVNRVGDKMLGKNEKKENEKSQKSQKSLAKITKETKEIINNDPMKKSKL
jgi:hypothetical protein